MENEQGKDFQLENNSADSPLIFDEVIPLLSERAREILQAIDEMNRGAFREMKADWEAIEDHKEFPFKKQAKRPMPTAIVKYNPLDIINAVGRMAWAEKWVEGVKVEETNEGFRELEQSLMAVAKEFFEPFLALSMPEFGAAVELLQRDPSLLGKIKRTGNTVEYGPAATKIVNGIMAIIENREEFDTRRMECFRYFHRNFASTIRAAILKLLIQSFSHAARKRLTIAEHQKYDEMIRKATIPTVKQYKRGRPKGTGRFSNQQQYLAALKKVMRDLQQEGLDITQENVSKRLNLDVEGKRLRDLNIRFKIDWNKIKNRIKMG